MARYRIYYEKRADACFVSHIALPTVFSRAAARAGVRFQRTEGFSPHAKISLGPELPVGVVALCEPADVWVEALDDELFQAWAREMPEGFLLKHFEGVPDGSPSIGKAFPVSTYLAKVRGDAEFFEFSLDNTKTLGALVRALVETGIVQGWHELCLVRKKLGGKQNEQ